LKFILRWTENGGHEKREQTEECVYLPIPGDLYTPTDGPQLRIEWRRLGGDAVRGFAAFDGFVDEARPDDHDAPPDCRPWAR
jgi:hypothetical protein